MGSEPFRIEHDSMGEVRVPADVLYGRRRSGRSRISLSVRSVFNLRLYKLWHW